LFSFFKQKHKDYKTLKKNGCKNYELLGQVFNKSTATGHLHFASTQLPPTSDEEREVEEVFLHKGVHITECNNLDTLVSKGKRPAEEFLPGFERVRKESKSKNFESCLDLLKTTLTARAEKKLLKPWYTKEAMHKVVLLLSAWNC
jgi:hypothetical protein